MKLIDSLVHAPVPECYSSAAMTIARYIMDNGVKESPSGLPLAVVDGVEHKLSRYLCSVINLDANVVAEVVAMMTATEQFNAAVFSTLQGDDIVAAYREGLGSSSCMTGSNSKLVRVYADNPQAVSMLVYDGCRGRALLWRTVTGDLVVDRIYPNSGPHVYHYYKWAVLNNAWTREHQGAEFPGWWHFSSGEATFVHNVLLHWPSNQKFPFMDSFRFATAFTSKGMLNVCSEHAGACTSEISRLERPAFPDFHTTMRGTTACCSRCKCMVDSSSIVDGECLICSRRHMWECMHCESTQDARTHAPLWAYVMDEDGDSEDQMFCQNCREHIYQCNSCGSWYYNESYEGSEVRGYNSPWCPNCIENSAYWCELCDSCVDSADWNSDNDCCDDCVPEEPEEE